MSTEQIDFEKLLDECKNLVNQLSSSDDQVSQLLKQGNNLIQKQRQIANLKEFLDDVYEEGEDGIQRRRIVDEFLEECRKTEQCVERNAIMTDYISDCFEMAGDLRYRMGILTNLCQKEEAEMKKNIPKPVMLSEEAGYAQAEARDMMRKVGDYVREAINVGESEALRYQEQYVAEKTYLDGHRAILSENELAAVNKLFKEGRALLESMLAERTEAAAAAIKHSVSTTEAKDDSEGAGEELNSTINEDK